MKVSTLLSTASMLERRRGGGFQPLFSKKLAVRALCLGNSVGGQHNPVAGFQLQTLGS